MTAAPACRHVLACLTATPGAPVRPCRRHAGQGRARRSGAAGRRRALCGGRKSACIRARTTPPLTAANSRAAPRKPLSAASAFSRAARLEPDGFRRKSLSSSRAMTVPLPLYASLAALGLGYLLGSIPFGLVVRLPGGRGRCAQDRLRQYRRHQCAAHRQEMGGGGDAALRRRQGRGGGSAGAPFPAARRGNLRRPGRGAGPSVSRLAEIQGRQRRRDLSGRFAGAALAGGSAGGGDLAGGGR